MQTSQVLDLDLLEMNDLPTRFDRERMIAEETTPQLLATNRDHVVGVLLKVGDLSIALDRKRLGGKFWFQGSLAQQVQRKVDVAGQHFDRESEGIVTGDRRQGAAHCFNVGSNFGGAPFGGVPGEQGRHQIRGTTLGRAFESRTPEGQQT